jgi:solute carrier family 25 2-oxodicarboxylate transporter 21
MLEAPKRAVKFAANDFWGKTYRSTFGAEKMTQGLSVLTGCSAGATESIVVVPFELVKIRLQDKNSTYKGPMDVIAQIVKKEGVFGMYAGLEPTFWRCVTFFPSSRLVVRAHTDMNRGPSRSHVSWNGGYFGCIFQVRSLMPKAQVCSRRSLLARYKYFR